MLVQRVLGSFGPFELLIRLLMGQNRFLSLLSVKVFFHLDIEFLHFGQEISLVLFVCDRVVVLDCSLQTVKGLLALTE